MCFGDRFVRRLFHHCTLPCEADDRHNGLVVFRDGNDMLRDCTKSPPRRQIFLRKFNGDDLVSFCDLVIKDGNGIGY